MGTRTLIMVIALLLSGCGKAPGPATPATPATPGSVQGIVVNVTTDAQGKVSDVQLNGESLGVDLQKLRQGVVPLVAAEVKAGKPAKAVITLSADVAQLDAQRVLAALTNDVVDGEARYRLVEEWELRVAGSPIVVTARSTELVDDPNADLIKREERLRSFELDRKR